MDVSAWTDTEEISLPPEERVAEVMAPTTMSCISPEAAPDWA